MKKILLLIYMMFPVLVMAQGHKGEVDECAPMKNGKVCYSDDVEIENTSKLKYSTLLTHGLRNLMEKMSSYPT